MCLKQISPKLYINLTEFNIFRVCSFLPGLILSNFVEIIVDLHQPLHLHLPDLPLLQSLLRLPSVVNVSFVLPLYQKLGL